MKRLDYIDPVFAQGVLDNWTESLRKTRELMAADPGRLVQTRYDFIAGYLEHMALSSYALGHPFEEIRDLLRQSVEAHEEVVRLRGTQDPFPVTVYVLNPNLPPTDPNYARQEPGHPPGTKEFSLGNAGDSYRATFLALISGQPELARRVALQIWDPPKPGWVGYHKYATCTINEQRLAFALRKFYEGDDEGALKLVRMIGPTRQERGGVLEQAAMWKALLEANPTRFTNALTDLLHVHKKGALMDKTDSNRFVCVAGLGLSVLALSRGLVDLKQLPADNPFLPSELLPRFDHL
jgi:hypothetical protein